MLLKQSTSSKSKERVWFWTGVGFASILFLTTLQTTINGSNSPYTNDTGEIQNVLPRWGTLHWTGYPQFSFLGSLLVSVLRLAGIEPAAGASVVSAVWAVIAIAFVILIIRELGSPIEAAVLGSLFLAVSYSFWMDASVAEVHSLTTAFTVIILYFALRFGKSGKKSDLLWLVFFSSQGVVHQRAVVLLAPAVIWIIYPEWKKIISNLAPTLGLIVFAPLTYLYLPLCTWLGVDVNWTFGQIGSLKGLWGMLTDNRADRVVQLPVGFSGWIDRFQVLFSILNDDLPWPILFGGLIGLLLMMWSNKRKEAIGLTLGWLPYAGLALIIWVGYVGDAILAAKLPILAISSIGLGLLMRDISGQQMVSELRKKYRTYALLAVVAVLGLLAFANYPRIVTVTRDQSAEKVISTVESVTPPADNAPTVVMALWGNDFWALAYAQAFENRLPGIKIVDHNANFNALLDDGYRLWLLSQIFYSRPLSWWDEHLGEPAVLSSVSPGVVQISTSPIIGTENTILDNETDLGNGIYASTGLVRSQNDLVLEVVWRAKKKIDRDYSVAVHLVANDPPQGPDDILSQADSANPIEGWYPTSRWLPGQVVTDHYLLSIPEDKKPGAIRIALYYQDENGAFINSNWLSVPVE